MATVITGIVCFVAGAVCCRLYYQSALTELESLRSLAKAEFNAFRKKL